MCTPANILAQVATSQVIKMAASKAAAVSTVAGTVGEYFTNKKNYQYKTQLALANAQNARNEALKQTQLGIEKSRLEKIEGLREVSKLKAKNSASGLDVMSQTSQMSYEDAINMSDTKADTVKKEYDASALNYFNQANSYLNEAKSYKKEYKQSLFDYSFNALGKVKSVANDWFTSKD